MCPVGRAAWREACRRRIGHLAVGCSHATTLLASTSHHDLGDYMEEEVQRIRDTGEVKRVHVCKRGKSS
jgi:hypothetical protein